MTNQERITAHNERLIALKEVAAGLPDAGGGGENVELVTLTIDWGYDNASPASFPFYDETINRMSFCHNTIFHEVGDHEYNNDRSSYKVRKNDIGYFPTGLWHFKPSDAVELLSDSFDGVHKFLADVTLTYD